MKKSILLCGLLLAATCGVASAAGLNLHWNTCAAGIVAAAQFQMPSALSGVTGIEVTLDLASASPTLPIWWQYNAGECRATELSMNGVAPSGAGCADWAGGTAQGGLAAYNEGAHGPNSAHILGGLAVAAARNLTSLTQNFFAFNLKILGDNTTAAGSNGVACGGCDVAVCIVFNGIKVVTPTTFLQISGAQAPGSNFITWQGGAGVTSLLGQGCPAATATHKSTWGQVKSLYR